MDERMPDRKKINMLSQCVLAFFPIVNLVAFFRIKVIGKGLLICSISFLLLLMFSASIRDYSTPNYFAYVMGKQSLAEGYTGSYYMGSAIGQFSMLILPFALPVLFVIRWTKKWNQSF